MIEIRKGTKAVAKGETYEEALVRLKDSLSGALLYPEAVDAGTPKTIHVRLKDRKGEYLEVVILKVVNA